MITVACIETGDYLGLGARYVQTLRAMVARHLHRPHRFCVVTDAPMRHDLPADEILAVPQHDEFGPSLPGWWAKLYLFRPGLFDGRVMYVDLDTVIVGAIDELVNHKGAVNLRDWGWDRDVSGGGTLLWDAGEHAELWAGAATAPENYADDQVYINAIGGWPALPAHLVRSYRYESKQAPQPGACMIAFHGQPKPHQVLAGWVPEHWRC